MVCVDEVVDCEREILISPIWQLVEEDESKMIDLAGSEAWCGDIGLVLSI